MSDQYILIYNTSTDIAYFVRSTIPILEVGQAEEFADHPKYYGIIQEIQCSSIALDSTTITLTITDAGNVSDKTIKLPLAFTVLIQANFNLTPP
jgi:hypothetical protein